MGFKKKGNMYKLQKIKVSEVHKKHLRVVGWLTASWALALGLAYISKNEYLVGLAPVLNFVGVIIQKELSGEGYRKALK